MTSETICALATVAGDAAVGVVRLSGPDAMALARRVCGRSGFVARRMTLVTISDPDSGQRLDQGMLCAMPGPRSYTGEDVVEVFGHGGRLNMGRLLALFVRLGARRADPGEFTRRAFVNGRMDLTQAEAVAELIAARSEAALSNAHALLGGALGQRVRQLRADAVRLAADLEACVDFAEEVEAPVGADDLRGGHRELLRELERLAGSYARGQRLGGISVALVGRVNAGKSSLLNALHGSPRALVSEQEGTTRDYLEVELQWEGRALTVVDTAGTRPASAMSALEAAGHELGRGRVARCDVVVLVSDVSVESEEVWPEWIGQAAGRVVAANKVDLVGDDGRLRGRLGQLGVELGCEVVGTSAESGFGLEALKEAVIRSMGGNAAAYEGDETFEVTQSRQHEQICRARQAAESGLEALESGLPAELVVEHLYEVLRSLGAITGESYSEEVLDSVFSRFCVGK